MLALGAVGALLATWLAAGRTQVWLVIPLGITFAWAGWRHGRRALAAGLLDVDGAGGAVWHDDEQARVGAPEAVPVRVERWFAGERIAWLRLRDARGRRHELLVGRGDVGEHDWRRLSAWLAWLRRGRAT